MGRKRKELDKADFYNWWLTKYHNTTVQEILEKEPDLCATSDWYKKYAVTQQQHDEWYEWAISTVAKYYGISNKLAKRRFCLDYLNLSPSVIDAKTESNE